MTDDKVAGEAMVVLMKEIIKVANTEYAEGRKDERERCAKIVADHAHEFGLVDRDSVLEKIRGGQDVDRCMKSLQK